jgi:thiosulfate reductase cytochrome b subunit
MPAVLNAATSRPLSGPGDDQQGWLSSRDFEIFVDEYADRLLSVARRLLRSEEDAADAVQDALLSAFGARNLGLNHRLAEGMAWHFTLMWGFALNGLFYVGYTLVSGEWRQLVPKRTTFREAWQVILHDLHLSRVELPRRKFNAAQQLAYSGVILMGLGSLLTGLAIYKPVQFAWLTTVLGGYTWARFEHFALTIGYVLFFVVHITQVIRAGWNNFRAMVCGYEVVELKEAQDG